MKYVQLQYGTKIDPAYLVCMATVRSIAGNDYQLRVMQECRDPRLQN